MSSRGSLQELNRDLALRLEAGERRARIHNYRKLSAASSILPKSAPSQSGTASVIVPSPHHHHRQPADSCRSRRRHQLSHYRERAGRTRFTDTRVPPRGQSLKGPQRA
ncbi:hypothetical protein D4764_03G0000930 [Takifugu flavidus]|uniref:Uncharacterized protein n=1 Tax=Takifugu flavidus TaxID=433684 RepID=A0A5C6N7J1_9TELE|nr:hypothetical protein D4764_03G0000930 [Takifugu flavidus]